MALPTKLTQQKVLYPVVVPNMANQVTFEGFLAARLNFTTIFVFSAWPITALRRPAPRAMAR